MFSQQQMAYTTHQTQQQQIHQQTLNNQNNELTSISTPPFDIYKVQNPTFIYNNNNSAIYSQPSVQSMPECSNQTETPIVKTSISQTIKPTFQTGTTRQDIRNNLNNSNQMFEFIDTNNSMNKIINGGNQAQWSIQDNQQIVDIQKQLQNNLYIESEDDTLSTCSSNSISNVKKIKRPINSFMMYCSKRRKELSAQNPALSTAEVSVILGDEWTNMSEEEKNNYILQSPLVENDLELDRPDYIYTPNPNNYKKRSIQSTESIIDHQKQPESYPPQMNCSPYMYSYQCPYPYTPQASPMTINYPVVQIKQSPNAFILFSADYRQKIKDENPDSSPGVISKLVGNAWKELPEKEKVKYYEEAKRLRNENNELKKIAKAQQKNLKNINKIPTPGIYSPYGQNTREHYAPYNYNYNYLPTSSTGLLPPYSVLPPQKRVRTPKDPTQPKHPSSAFLFYFQDVRTQYMSKYSKKSLGAISKMISESWKKLTPEEKAKYVEKSEQDKKRYNLEMKKINTRRKSKICRKV
jgi:hypothetical protein